MNLIARVDSLEKRLGAANEETVVIFPPQKNAEPKREYGHVRILQEGTVRRVITDTGEILTGQDAERFIKRHGVFSGRNVSIPL